LLTEMPVSVGMPVDSSCYSGFSGLVSSVFVDLRVIPMSSHILCF
jgi:hypothetical protein